MYVYACAVLLVNVGVCVCAGSQLLGAGVGILSAAWCFTVSERHFAV